MGLSRYILISSIMTFFSVSKSSTRSVGLQDVRQNVERLRKILGQAGHVIERVFFRRLCVVLGTDPIEVVVDGRPRRADLSL